MSRSIDSLRQRPLDEVLTKMIALDFQTSSILKDSGFWRFWLELNHNYVFPSPKSPFKTITQALYKKPHDRVNGKVDKVEAVCLTTELWTFRTTTSFIVEALKIVSLARVLSHEREANSRQSGRATFDDCTGLEHHWQSWHLCFWQCWPCCKGPLQHTVGWLHTHSIWLTQRHNSNLSGQSYTQEHSCLEEAKSHSEAAETDRISSQAGLFKSVELNTIHAERECWKTGGRHHNSGLNQSKIGHYMSRWVGGMEQACDESSSSLKRSHENFFGERCISFNFKIFCCKSMWWNCPCILKAQFSVTVQCVYENLEN